MMPRVVALAAGFALAVTPSVAHAACADTPSQHNELFGLNAGAACTTGQYNTIVGYNVGMNTLAIGSQNILIGVDSSTDTTSSSASNTLNIGNAIYGVNLYNNTNNGGTISGQIGINTASPQSALQVNGGVQVGTGNTCSSATAGEIEYVGGSISYCNGTSYTAPTAAAAGSSGNIQYNSGSGVLTASSTFTYSGGNVGIGTTAPANLLHVYGGGSTSDTTITAGPGGNGSSSYGLNIGYGGNTYGAGISYINAHSSSGSSGQLYFDTDANIRMAINNSGNVGIGTTAPGAELQIVKNSTYNNEATAGLWVGNASSPLKFIDFGYDTSIDAGYIQSIDSTVTYKNLVLNPNAGNVGIGTTSPTQALDLGGGNIALQYTQVTNSCGASTSCTATCPGNGYVVGGGCELISNTGSSLEGFPSSNTSYTCLAPVSTVRTFAICLDVR